MTRSSKSIISVALYGSLAAGCATTPEGQQAQGALLGATLGGITCALLGGNAAECIGSAAAGGVVGWGAVKLYQASQTRSATQDREVYSRSEPELYGLTKPITSTTVKIRRGSSMPNTVKPGQAVTIVTNYSVVTPPNIQSVEVEESWVLKKDGKPLTTLQPQRNQRTAGGWEVQPQVQVPSNAEPGTYVIEHKVQAGTSYDVDESVFYVVS